jgi:polysaccharide export outer membrane protein
MRSDGTHVATDLARATQTGDPGANVPLQPGDVVTVPRLQPRKVLVVGGVVKPGPYPITEDITVAEALKLAEGPREKADLKSATVTRADGRIVPVDLERLIHDGDVAQNLKLGDGDELLVPEKLIRVYVAGEVKKPDVYMLPEGTTLVDAVTESGWFTKEADLKQVRLVHRNAGGAVQPETLDLRDLAAKGPVMNSPSLKDGDLILVLTRGKAKRAEDYLPFVYPLDVLRHILFP